MNPIRMLIALITSILIPTSSSMKTYLPMVYTRFEPVYSASEISEHMNTSVEHVESDKSEQHVESERSMNSMDWCICKHCSLDRNITDKIFCRNPMIRPDDKFTDVDCITETETFNLVCLNKEILRTSMATWNELTSEKRALVNFRFIGYKQVTGTWEKRKEDLYQIAS